MHHAFLKLENLRQQLCQYAQNHQWSACLPLTEELRAQLNHLPIAQTDNERQILNNTLESFQQMHQSALSAHGDIQKLLNAFEKAGKT